MWVVDCLFRIDICDALFVFCCIGIADLFHFSLCKFIKTSAKDMYKRFKFCIRNGMGLPPNLSCPVDKSSANCVRILEHCEH